VVRAALTVHRGRSYEAFVSGDKTLVDLEISLGKVQSVEVAQSRPGSMVYSGGSSFDSSSFDQAPSPASPPKAKAEPMPPIPSNSGSKF